MNAAVRSVVRTALFHGIECYGIRRGYNGLIAGDLIRLDEKSISHTINRGGTILYTARSKEFMTEEGQKKAVSTCRFLGLDGIVAIGGDGTFRGAQALSKYGINVICIPATIDNDIGCTNYTIGFDTAANTRFNGFTHYMIVVAEGSGSAAEISAKIKDAIDLDPRVTVLGHIQRGGIPTGRDRVNATKMGYLAVELLLEGKTNKIICTQNGRFTDVDINEGLDTERHIQDIEVEVLAAMTGI